MMLPWYPQQKYQFLDKIPSKTLDQSKTAGQEKKGNDCWLFQIQKIQ